ncbi:MAG: L-2-hydroxyglutarate oxidase [Rhodobacteraceae bacterium]|nr:L-2-hydroxyglutarate oxidase [Paracoccaceae bacterium]
MLDLIAIGGGIVGIATAREMLRRHPDLALAVLEKETGLARHQTGRNSGVIHAGIYYAPDSLKARFCRAGLAATYAFCAEQELPAERCGKLLVATSEAELQRMEALHDRARANGVALTRLSQAELREREPNIRGLGAVESASTGIADYAAITRRMADLVAAAGGTVSTGEEVLHLVEDEAGVTVETRNRSLTARQVIVCAGIQADRFAAMSGLGGDFMMVPFRGEYYRLAPRCDDIVRQLIYPIPDPALPFLGIHLTRMIGGYVTVGPNAVLAGAREGYRLRDVSLRDLGGMARFPGLRKMLRKNLSHGVSELANSLLRSRYLAACQRYCPSLEARDLQPHPAGVRAQAVMADGTLVHDFMIRTTRRIIHVCNAPSPAATSAMPIAAHVADVAGELFGLTA